MPLGILGNKIGMTQILDESGNMVPVTILRAGPCTVTQIKTIETDGYEAIQLGYAQVSSKVLTPRIRVSQIANAQKKQRHRFSSLKR